MGTRFRPADPAAVRERFAAIRARALERVAEEERHTMARLAAERLIERGVTDAPERSFNHHLSPRPRVDDGSDGDLGHWAQPADAGND
jgi:hypothetical protein